MILKKVLSIDMGATSIRGIVGYLKDGNIICEEVMRLQHHPIKVDGRLKWEFDILMNKIIETIIEHNQEICSVGIDTWGVDFGAIDRYGQIVVEPISYRDEKHQIGYNEAISEVGKEYIYLQSGTQLMALNTLYQLITLKKLSKAYEKISKVLMLPDFINYILCGAISEDLTMMSTTQIFNLKDKVVNKTLINRFGIKEDIFADIVFPGTIIGNTKNSSNELLKKCDVNVIEVCGHDTASAVLLTEAMFNEETMFLSCGTWSLVGAVNEVLINEETYKYSFTNELGYGGKNLFFKNITGLYLLEKYKSQLEYKLKKKIDFKEITEFVLNDKETKSTVDMEDDRFSYAEINAKEAIASYLLETNQKIPKEEFSYFTIIYKSLVKKYKVVKNQLEKLTNKTYKNIHIIGGGVQSEMLCQMIANELNVQVKAGPIEATALGNIILQLKAMGEIDNIEEFLFKLREQLDIKIYKPVKGEKNELSKDRN